VWYFHAAPAPGKIDLAGGTNYGKKRLIHGLKCFFFSSENF
jgi:hypothetical protein